jgi:SAM-dependent methyltransferase
VIRRTLSLYRPSWVWRVLDTRDRWVLLMRAGWIDGQIHSLGAVGDGLKVTPERIRQIQNAAMRKLRGDHTVRMQERWEGGNCAEEANSLFAPAYDDFNYRYQNRNWTRVLLGKAETAEADLTRQRLLDLGCGTGLSFLPMLDRGWEVTGCDISLPMLEIATGKAGGRANLFVGDFRELPTLEHGPFDLVWAVNDGMNYLLSTNELHAALDGIRRNLAPEGVALFDLNTLETYRTFFAEEVVVERNGRKLIWSGRVKPKRVRPGMLAEATFLSIGEQWSPHVHMQRHFPEGEVLFAIQAAGLRPVSVYGELEGKLDEVLDEGRHSKAVYVCKRDDWE